MQAAIAAIQAQGYTIKTRGDNLIVLPPPCGEFSEEVYPLIEQVKANKLEALKVLAGFMEVPPSAGDLHVINIDAMDEREMLRWALAVDAGLIFLEEKILFWTAASTGTIRYRCSFPPEWLSDAIDRAAKQKYSHTLERIQNGAKWLQEHDEGHPDYERCYTAYLELYENLRKLYVAIDEPLDDPMTGYEEVAAK